MAEVPKPFKEIDWDTADLLQNNAWFAVLRQKEGYS